MANSVVILGVFVADTAYRADRAPRMGETILGNSFALGPGGKGSNQAVAAARLGADPRFELVAPHPFALVCFRASAGNETTEALAAAINAAGDVAVTPMQLGDDAIIRVSVGQSYTEAEHVERLWNLIDTHTPAIQEES